MTLRRLSNAEEMGERRARCAGFNHHYNPHQAIDIGISSSCRSQHVAGRSDAREQQRPSRGLCQQRSTAEQDGHDAGADIILPGLLSEGTTTVILTTDTCHLSREVLKVAWHCTTEAL